MSESKLKIKDKYGWKSFWPVSVFADDMVLDDKYNIKEFGDLTFGRYLGYFIVLTEILIEEDANQASYSADDLAGPEQIKEFQRFLHEDLKIPMDDVKANCSFHVVPEFW